jgi:hypothetical protein
MTAPWGTTHESVAAWCELPISWNGKRAGHRNAPELDAGDAIKIVCIVERDLLNMGVLSSGEVEDEEEAWHQFCELAHGLDEALYVLECAYDGGDWTEIADALKEAEGYLDDWYYDLRRALQAAEEAELQIMCGTITRLDRPAGD